MSINTPTITYATHPRTARPIIVDKIAIFILLYKFMFLLNIGIIVS